MYDCITMYVYAYMNEWPQERTAEKGTRRIDYWLPGCGFLCGILGYYLRVAGFPGWRFGLFDAISWESFE